MLKLEDWDWFRDESGELIQNPDLLHPEIKIPEVVNTVQVAYDGGRIYIKVNDQILYENLDAGRDFTITIDKE